MRDDASCEIRVTRKAVNATELGANSVQLNSTLPSQIPRPHILVHTVGRSLAAVEAYIATRRQSNDPLRISHVIRFGVMATVAVLETEALACAVGKLQDLPASSPTRAVGVHIMYAMRCHLRCLTASVVIPEQVRECRKRYTIVR